MRMILKKPAIFAALAVTLLITAALVTGCPSPMGGAGLAGEYTGLGGGGGVVSNTGNFKPPAGKGVIRFNLSDGRSGARTIFPDFTSFDLEDMYFVVDFTSDAGTTANNETYGPFSYDDFQNVPHVLTDDDYNISISAFNNGDKDATTVMIAGWDSDTPETVAVGVTTSVPVALKGVTDGGDDGTFSYSITTPANPIPASPGTFVARLDVFDHGTTNSPTGFPVTLTVNGLNEGDVDIPSGYYDIKITVSQTGYATRGYVRALHIYPEMTSSLSYTVLALLRNLFDVTFNLDGKTLSNSGTGAGQCDTTTQQILNSNYVSDIPVTGGRAPQSASWNFDNWYNQASGGTAWNFNGNRIYADTTIYARWTPKQGISFDISFTSPTNIAEIDDPNPVIDIGAIDRGGDVTLKLQAPPVGTAWATHKWFINGFDVQTGGDLVIDDSMLEYFIETDIVTIQVVGTTTVGSIPYDATITVTVTNTP